MLRFLSLYCAFFLLSIAPADAQRQIQLVNPDFGSTPLEARRGEPAKPSELVFYYYPYTTNVLQLQHFRQVNPWLENHVPDSIALEVPSLDWAKSVSYAVGYLSGDRPEAGALVIFLVINYDQPLPIFLFDTDLDRNFRNENDNAYIFDSPNRQRKRIRVSRPDGKRYSFYLINPAYQREVPVSQTVRSAYVAKVQEQDNFDEYLAEHPRSAAPDFYERGLFLNAHLTTGYGKIKYFYNTSEDGNSYTNYRIRYNPVGVGTSLEGVWQKFSLRVEGSFNTLEYQNSTLDKVSTVRDGSGQLISQSAYRNNFDLHPQWQLTLGGRIGYYIPVSKSLSFHPTVGVSRSWYDTDVYLSDKEMGEPAEEILSDFRQVGFGLSINFIALERLAFFLEGYHNELALRPQAFYDRLATEGENNGFKSSHRLTYVNVGVQIKLGK